MYQKISKKDKIELVKKYWKGQSVASLCSESGIPRSTLYSWLKPYRQLQSSEKCLYSFFTQKDYTDLKRHADKLEKMLEIVQATGCTAKSPLDEKIEVFRSIQGQYSARLICDALNISRSTYHKRIIKNDNPSMNEQHKQEISKQIRAVFDESEQRYGADKILAVLTARGFRTSKKFILQRMREMGLKSISVHSKKDYVKLNPKRNIVRQHFFAERPNQIWVSDVTYIKYQNHFFFLCVIIDIFSRKVIAHRISPRNSTQLITFTFREAYNKRSPEKGLIFHSDRGTQYTSTTFRKLLVSCNVTQSFSRTGTPYDNAVAESFFAFLKREEIYRRNY